MHYIKEVLKKNRIWILAYVGLGIFNSFMANYKADYFQKVIDGLADRTLGSFWNCDIWRHSGGKLLYELFGAVSGKETGTRDLSGF